MPIPTSREQQQEPNGKGGYRHIVWSMRHFPFVSLTRRVDGWRHDNVAAVCLHIDSGSKCSVTAFYSGVIRVLKKQMTAATSSQALQCFRQSAVLVFEQFETGTSPMPRIYVYNDKTAPF